MYGEKRYQSSNIPASLIRHI